MAEALSLRKALAFASSLDLTHVEVENGCQQLIRACNTETNRGGGEIFNIFIQGGFLSAVLRWISQGIVTKLLTKLHIWQMQTVSL